MDDILAIIDKRKEELKEDFDHVTRLLSSPEYHSSRINQSLTEAIGQVDPEKPDVVVRQLMSIINQVPTYVAAGVTQLEVTRSDITARINELGLLTDTIIKARETTAQVTEAKQEFLDKVNDGEITEASITGSRQPGTRPESLSKLRKLTQEPIKTED